MHLYVTLEEVLNGNFVEVEFHFLISSIPIIRAKSVVKQTSSSRRCNCRIEMRTIQMRHGQVRFINNNLFKKPVLKNMDHTNT